MVLLSFLPARACTHGDKKTRVESADNNNNNSNLDFLARPRYAGAGLWAASTDLAQWRTTSRRRRLDDDDDDEVRFTATARPGGRRSLRSWFKSETFQRNVISRYASPRPRDLSLRSWFKSAIFMRHRHL